MRAVERNDYYPFGLRHPNTAYPTLSSNRYGYNGKELQSPTTSGSYLDYGARFLDPALGRWTTQDPMSEKYLSLTPYNFCGNDGVNYVDKTGKIITVFGDKSFTENFVNIGTTLRKTVLVIISKLWIILLKYIQS